MVQFQTLFLGIVFGLWPVRVAVSPPVSSVEIVLDGATAGAVSAGARRTFSIAMTAPDLPPGSLIANAGVVAVVDPDNRIAESNESNNTVRTIAILSTSTTRRERVGVLAPRADVRARGDVAVAR